MISGTGYKKPRAKTGTPVSVWLVWVGLFTISWDRFATARIGTFSLKVAVVAFALASVATMADAAASNRARRPLPPTLRWANAVLVLFVLAASLASQHVPAFLQVVAVLLGAAVPVFAVYETIRIHNHLDQALSAFIRGGAFASVFGLYQLFAFYSKLPQIVPYTSTAAGLGRISAFNYEAGYFGYFIALVIAALFARAALRHEPVNRRHVAAFVAVLLLANTRASLLTIPILAALLLFRWPQRERRPRIWPFAIAAIYLVSLAALVAPTAFSSATAWAASIVNPSEKASNAPRLQTFAIAWDVARDHPYTGVGPGNFAIFAKDYGKPIPPGAGTNEVVVNDVWLQALVDGGPLLALAEFGLVLSAAHQLYRRRNTVARALVSGWIAVMTVASLITSYYFDVKLWAILGIALGATAVADDNGSTEFAPKHGSSGELTHRI
jgi:putative inorganic carbon (HCO3(-)) transporter